MWNRKPCLPAFFTIVSAAITAVLGRYVLQVNADGMGWLVGLVGIGLVLSFSLATLLLLATTVYCWRIRGQRRTAAQDDPA